MWGANIWGFFHIFVGRTDYMSGILLLNNYFTYVDFVSALVTFVVAVFLAKLQVPCADSRWTPFNRMRWLMVGAYRSWRVKHYERAPAP